MTLSVAGILGLGLVIGMQHALEADHVAAVSSIAVRQRNVRRIIAHGAIWGAGHTITLMLFAGAAVLAGAAISETMAGWLEFTVGFMLVALGLSVIWRMWRDRVHFHVHSHEDGKRHFHAHSHAGEAANRHDPRRHEHNHRRGAMARTLVIGMIHGMAGSAALLVLTAAAAPTPMVGIAYIAIFGIGSIAGMALLSAAIAVPLTWTARYLTAAHNGLQLAVGATTAGLGFYVMVEKWCVLGI